jgi:hypothetical protein
MICKILRFVLPRVITECDEPDDDVVVTCQDWSINEYGETSECELELHSDLPWDLQKLGRLSIGEDKAVSMRHIYGLVADQEYDVTVTLKALMTESIPFFTEEFHLTLTMGELQTVKVFSNDNEYVVSNFTLTADSDGQIALNLSTTSSNFQVDSISGTCL